MAIDAIAPASGAAVLVSGATGRVGALALQLAKTRGARVMATASPDQAGFVKELEADETVGSTADVGTEVRKISSRGVECVVHLAGDAVSLVELCVPRGRS